jgi:hypothetical protein
MFNPRRGIFNSNVAGISDPNGTSTAAPVAERLRTTQLMARSPNLMTAPSETKYRGALVFRSIGRPASRSELLLFRLQPDLDQAADGLSQILNENLQASFHQLSDRSAIEHVEF